MYDGTPQLRLEGDVSAEQIRAGKVFLERIQAVRQSTGVSTFAGQQNLGNGAYVYALTSGPIHVIQIVAPRVLTEELPAIDGTQYPFLGGVVFNGTLRNAQLPNSGTVTRVLSTFAPTEITQRTYKLPEGKQNTALLTVTPFTDDMKNKRETGFEFSQYTMLKPTMYTGAMKFVVQCLMSFGKQKIKMTTADAAASHIAFVAANGFRVLYDYRFASTHGIVFGTDGVPWLVEISITNGVIMMPLPRFAWSKKADYYAKVEAKVENGDVDSAILAFLDLFGGLPTGEGFPANLELAIKEGRVLQPIKPDDPTLKEFYECVGYSSAMGWAFSASGAKAHNTGYYFNTELEVFFGRHYELTFTVGDLVTDNYRLKLPIASATVTLTKLAEGPLIQRQSAPLFIKFYEPLLLPSLGGLLSVDVYPPVGKGRQYDSNCDTPMHVFFVGEELKVVRYFRSIETEEKGDVSSDYPDCPYGGRWRILELHTGTSQVPTQFISNDWDKRDTISEMVEISELESNDLGYGMPYWVDRLQDPDFSDVKREKIFLNTTTTTIESGEAHRSVVMVPAGMREAYYIGHEIVIPSVKTSITKAQTAVTDPNVGIAFRKLFDRDFGPAAGCTKKSKNRIIVELPEPVSFDPCSEVADSGQWLQMCQDVEGFTGSPLVPQTVVQPETDEVYRSVEAMLFFCTEIPDTVLSVTPETFEGFWMTRSPDPQTSLVQYIAVGTNTFGEDCTVYQPNPSEPLIVTGDTVVPPGDDGNLTFIGVVP